MAAIPQDSIVYYDGGQLKRVAAGSEVELTGAGSMFKAVDLTATGTVTGASGSFGSMNITGNLVVGGDIISGGSVNVVLSDSFLDLNGNNLLGSPGQPGGLAVNVLSNGTSPFSTVSFSAGSAGVDPTVVVTGDASALAAGDLIQISQSTSGANDGQYAVVSAANNTPVAGQTTITVRGGPTTANPVPTTSAPFLHNQFSAGADTAAKVIGITVGAFAVSGGALPKKVSGTVSAGEWAYAYGSNLSAFLSGASTGWTSVAPAAATSLQGAYDNSSNPATIDMSTALGGLTIKPGATQTAAITLQANAASEFTVNGAALTLGASRIDLNTGDVKFAKAGVVAATTTGRADGDVVYFDTSFAAQPSDNNGAAAALRVDGVVASAGYVATVAGTRVYVNIGGGSPTAGTMVYLSATPGQGTTTIPGSGRVTELGTTTGNNAAGLSEIVWNPQYIIDLP